MWVSWCCTLQTTNRREQNGLNTAAAVLSQCWVMRSFAADNHWLWGRETALQLGSNFYTLQGHKVFLFTSCPQMLNWSWFTESFVDHVEDSVITLPGVQDSGSKTHFSTWTLNFPPAGMSAAHFYSPPLTSGSHYYCRFIASLLQVEVSVGSATLIKLMKTYPWVNSLQWKYCTFQTLLIIFLYSLQVHASRNN